MYLRTTLASPWIIVFLAQTSIAQDARQTLTALPSERVMCRVMDVTKADSADVLLTFLEAKPFPRETIVAYTNAGQPLYMAILLTEEGSVESVSHRMAVRFSGTGVYMRVRLVNGSGSSEPGVAPIAVEDITLSDVTKAQKLANLLWARRCKSHRH